MKWRRSVLRNGLLRKQFKTWQLPKHVTRAFGSRDGDAYEVSGSFGTYRFGPIRAVLTSGTEIYLPKIVASALGSEAELTADREIEFETIPTEHSEIERTLIRAQEKALQTGAYDPGDDSDARDHVAAAIVRRRGQPAFRMLLLQAYKGRCAISNCDCIQALEAAHIRPYRGEHTNDVRNGILLRADLHTLFDLGAITITAGFRVQLSKDALEPVMTLR